MIRKLEEISMNAWPSLSTVLYDGWVIRFANGVTRRANSVNPIYSSSILVDEKIEYCEKLYKNYKQQAVYKMTSDVFPKNLDLLLDERGYEKVAMTSFQTMNLNAIGKNNFDGIKINTKFDDKWLMRFMAISEANESIFLNCKNMIKNIKMKTCYVDLVNEGKYIGSGLGVLEDGYIGLFEIVILKDERNKGNGYKIVNSILNWGATNGADNAYLQVMIDNPSALSLYEKIGFKEEYKYWYRVKE